MFNTYSFLTEHSYSLRPDSGDDSNNNNQKLSLNKKKKTSRRTLSTNRTSKTVSKKTSNRTISIDRSSSDKENTSIPLRSSTRQINSTLQKKQDKKKVPVKKTSSAAIRKKKVSMNSPKAAKFIEKSDTPPSLSIEERVKLRRTKTPQSSTILLPKQASKAQSLSKKKISKQQPINKKSTKLFLGSGLDLDNIVLGNRQRRSVQT